MFDNIKPIDAPSFAYRGGKARLRRFIVKWLDLQGSVFVEPFAGRANVFFLMRTIASFDKWILNDLQTIDWLEDIKSYDGQPLPFVTKEDCAAFLEQNSLEARLLEPLLLWAGGLKGKSSITGSRNHDLQNYSEQLLRAKKLLQGVEFLRKDAVELLSVLPDDSFVYLDPPYLGANVGSYHDNMLDRDRLIHVLQKAKFKWVMSEYRCADFDLAFGNPIVEYKGVFVNPTPSSKSSKRVVEVLYSNFKKDKFNVIDFEDKVRPFAVSLEILRNNKILDKKTFNDCCPAHWGEGTRKAQWARLTCLPDVWFDGEVIENA